MSTSDTVITITILDKDYPVNCPADQHKALIHSAFDLDKRMHTIRREGNVIGMERIAVMAALNLSYELLEAQSKIANNASNNEKVEHLNNKLSTALKALSSRS